MNIDKQYLRLTVFCVALVVFLSSPALFANMPSKTMDLSQQFSPEEIQTVTLNETLVDFLVFESNLAENRGTVLILANPYESAANSFLLNIATTLPNSGWSSVVLFDEFLVAKDSENEEKVTAQSQASPEKPSADEPIKNANNESMNDSDTIQSYAAVENPMTYQSNIKSNDIARCSDTFEQTLSSFMQVAQLPASRTVLLASGHSSACVLHANQLSVNALITLNPFVQDAQLNKKLASQFAQFPLPILDMLSSNQNQWAASMAQKRKIEAVRNLKKYYRQREIIGQPLSPTQTDYVVKEIYGWLTYLGY